MKKLFGKSILSHVIERVKQSKGINEIVIATSTLAHDEVISKEAIKCGVNYYRGSEDDVLSRYYFAAKENDADVVVRITDPIIIDKIIKYYKNNSYNLVTNAGIDSDYRWTLDTKEDWELIRKIYQYLYNGKHNFFLKDIVRLTGKYPELQEINNNIEQKKAKLV